MSCVKCEGLNEKGISEAAPGWGNLFARVFFVGQSLCTQCMSTMVPFTEGSGYYIDAALRLSGLRRTDVFFSNVVHCHPSGNRTSTPEEKRLCLPYLFEEFDLIKPKLIILMGNDAIKTVGPHCKGYVYNRSHYNTWDHTSCKQKHDSKAIGMYHPAYFLRRGGAGAINWVIELSLILDKYKD